MFLVRVTALRGHAVSRHGAAFLPSYGAHMLVSNAGVIECLPDGSRVFA
jgi:hypothetical protein